MTTVLIVDDHPSFRASARAILEAEGFDVIGEANDGSSRRDRSRRLRPDVVLLDVHCRIPTASRCRECLAKNGLQPPDRARLEPRRRRLRRADLAAAPPAHPPRPSSRGEAPGSARRVSLNRLLALTGGWLVGRRCSASVAIGSSRASDHAEGRRRSPPRSLIIAGASFVATGLIAHLAPARQPHRAADGGDRLRLAAQRARGREHTLESSRPASCSARSRSRCSPTSCSRSRPDASSATCTAGSPPPSTRPPCSCRSAWR